MKVHISVCKLLQEEEAKSHREAGGSLTQHTSRLHLCFSSAPLWTLEVLLVHVSHVAEGSPSIFYPKVTALEQEALTDGGMRNEPLSLRSSWRSS